MDLGEASADEIILTAGGERSAADALTGGVVVDRLAALVGCAAGGLTGHEACIATDVRSVGVVQVEEQAGGQAHGLDRHELVGHESTEDTADDGEGDVGEAADVATGSLATTTCTEAVNLAEELGSLVLEEASHGVTLDAVEAAEKSCAVPLLEEPTALIGHIPIANALCELVE